MQLNYKILIYLSLFFTFCLHQNQAIGQYTCDYEYKVMNKQKKKVKKKTKKIALKWLNEHMASLNLPTDLKPSKLKYKTEKKEAIKWDQIDALLCKKKKEVDTEAAFKIIEELRLVVYDISIEFDYANTVNDRIKSVLNFEFDINGNLIRAVIRKKKMSPFSETPYQ